MAGLTSLSTKINIKDEPHHLAYITKEEGDILKSMGAVGKPMQGTKGIPAYIGVGDKGGLGADYGPGGDMYGGHFSMKDDAAHAAHLKEAARAHNIDEFAFHPDYDKAIDEAEREMEDVWKRGRNPDDKLSPDQIAYMYDSKIAKELDLEPSQVNTRGISTHDLEDLYASEMIGWNELNNNPVYQQQKAAEDLAERQRDAKALQDKFAAQGIEATVAIDPEGGHHYGGPDAFQAAGGEMYDAAKFVATQPMVQMALGTPAVGLAAMTHQAALSHPDVKAAYDALPVEVQAFINPSSMFKDKEAEAEVEVPEELTGPATELDSEQWAEMEQDYGTAQEVEGTEGIVRPPQKTIVREEVPEEKIVFDPQMKGYFERRRERTQPPWLTNLFTKMYAGRKDSGFQQFLIENNLENANPFVQRAAWIRANQVPVSKQQYPKAPGSNQQKYLNELYSWLA